MKLIIDQRETVWTRLWVDVDADSIEEAVKEYHNGVFEIEDSELLEFTGEVLEEVIMDESHDIIKETCF